MIKMNHYIIIDGNNVAYHKRNRFHQPMLENIVLGMKWVLYQKYLPIVIISGRLIKYIDDKKKLDYFVELGKISQSPTDIKDDRMILKVCVKEKAYILSNDKFRDHYQEFDKNWIEKIRISYLIVNGTLYSKFLPSLDSMEPNLVYKGNTVKGVTN